MDIHFYINMAILVILLTISVPVGFWYYFSRHPSNALFHPDIIDFVVDNNREEDKIPSHYIRGAMGVYLHGELETKAKYDICACSVDVKDFPDGIYKASYKRKTPCTLFFWTYMDGKVKRQRGYVVENTDEKWYEHALKTFEKRKKNI